MIPVLTPEEMAGVDKRAVDPVEVLVGRAGAAVARRAGRCSAGPTAGAVVVVLAARATMAPTAGPRQHCFPWPGASVEVLEASSLARGQRLPPADLVIDAAYGTGLQRAY